MLMCISFKCLLACVFSHISSCVCLQVKMCACVCGHVRECVHVCILYKWVIVYIKIASECSFVYVYVSTCIYLCTCVRAHVKCMYLYVYAFYGLLKIVLLVDFLHPETLDILSI